jgi:hypothetical protein
MFLYCSVYLIYLWACVLFFFSISRKYFIMFSLISLDLRLSFFYIFPLSVSNVTTFYQYFFFTCSFSYPLLGNDSSPDCMMCWFSSALSEGIPVAALCHILPGLLAFFVNLVLISFVETWLIITPFFLIFISSYYLLFRICIYNFLIKVWNVLKW